MGRESLHSNLVLFFLFFPLRPQLSLKQRPTIAASMYFVISTSLKYSGVNFLFKLHWRAVFV